MKRLSRTLTLASLLAAGSAQATQQGTTTDGSQYLSGGVSQDERDALKAQRDHFSLWIVTAQQKTGAYLSAVHLTITDAQKKLVFDAPLDGPWLLVDLPLGTYRVGAEFEGQSQHRATTVHTGDHHQVMFYFSGSGDSPSVSPSVGPPVSP
jgi:hypothetical protein